MEFQLFKDSTPIKLKDPLDFAYFIMGMQEELLTGNIDTGEWDGGQLAFVQSVMGHVGVIDTLWQETDFEENGCNGVWAYEVVEPLGQFCAQLLWASRSENEVREILLDHGRQLIKEMQTMGEST